MELIFLKFENGVKMEFKRQKNLIAMFNGFLQVVIKVASVVGIKIR